MTQPLPPAGLAIFIALALFGLNTPANALDCTKATSPVDKAICADSAATSADNAMSGAFSSLYGSLPEPEKKQLLQSQRSWLKQRAGMCSEEKTPSAKCLTVWSERRSLFLQGKPETGPGTGHDLTPVVLMQAPSRRAYQRDITLMKFKSPALLGEKLFNSEIDKLLKDAPSEKDNDDQTDMTYTYDLHLRLTYASPRFLSAVVETYAFEGGAHGNSGTNGINIDIAKGKPLEFADAFVPAASQKLEDMCFTQIKARKTEDGSDADLDAEEIKQMRDTIREDIVKLGHWSFSATDATLTFDPYEIGSYAEGSYTCEFQLGALRPLYKAESVLP